MQQILKRQVIHNGQFRTVLGFKGTILTLDNGQEIDKSKVTTLFGGMSRNRKKNNKSNKTKSFKRR